MSDLPESGDDLLRNIPGAKQQNFAALASREPGDEFLGNLPEGQHRNFKTLRSARATGAASSSRATYREAAYDHRGATSAPPATASQAEGDENRLALHEVPAEDDGFYDLDGFSLDFIPSEDVGAAAAAEGVPTELGTITLRFLDEGLMWIDLVCVARRGHSYSRLPIALADVPPGSDDATDDDEQLTDVRAMLLLHPGDADGPDTGALRAALEDGERTGVAVTPAGLGAFVLLMIDLG